MKIGIMSMQRIVNNGSFLQSYSLMKIITNMGHQVEFVDYEPGKPLVFREEKVTSFISILKKIKKHIGFPLERKKSEIKKDFQKMGESEKIYKQKMLPLLHLTEEYNYCPKLDVLFIGSDEVFNCLQPNPEVGYAKQLFGKNNNAKKVCSYAASFGNTSLNGLKKYKIAEEITEDLKKFESISVRDKNSYKIIETLLGKAPEYHVDPVFLYDYEKEMPDTIPEKDYIVVYAYDYRIEKKEAREILKFAKKYRKKIICLCGVQRYFGRNVITNPFEVLTYIKNADYVITDTFHGTVFSIKFNRKFVTLVRGGEEGEYGNSFKLEDLLERFGMLERKIMSPKDLEPILRKEVDMNPANKIIETERKNSLNYLKNMLEG